MECAGLPIKCIRQGGDRSMGVWISGASCQTMMMEKACAIAWGNFHKNAAVLKNRGPKMGVQTTMADSSAGTRAAVWAPHLTANQRLRAKVRVLQRRMVAGMLAAKRRPHETDEEFRRTSRTVTRLLLNSVDWGNTLATQKMRWARQVARGSAGNAASMTLRWLQTVGHGRWRWMGQEGAKFVWFARWKTQS